MRHQSLFIFCFAGFLLVFQSTLLASPLAEQEPNDTIGTAQNADGFYSLDANPDIANSTTNPHVEINGSGNGTFDYYSFSIPAAGTQGTFDIDYENFDSELFLYDTNGNLLASNDDNGGDPGSGGGLASRIDNFTFSAGGTYVIGVGEFNSTGSFGGATGNTPDPGDTYTLHISLTATGLPECIGDASGFLGECPKDGVVSGFDVNSTRILFGNLTMACDGEGGLTGEIDGLGDASGFLGECPKDGFVNGFDLNATRNLYGAACSPCIIAP